MIFYSILIFILAMSLSKFNTQITPMFFSRITAVTFIYAGVLTFNALYIQSIGSGIGIYSGLFQVTYYNLFIEMFLYITGSIIMLSWALVTKSTVENSKTLILSDFKVETPQVLNSSSTEINYLESKDLPVSNSKGVNGHSLAYSDLVGGDVVSVKNSSKGFDSMRSSSIITISSSEESREYSLIALFSLLGSSFLLSSGDLLSMYLSIELQSFGLYILATLYRDSGSATSAGLKYFLLGGLSSCLILLGGALVYSLTGLTSFESIYSLVSVFFAINGGSANELIDLGVSELSMPYESLSLISQESIAAGGLASSLSSIANFSQGLSLGLILIVVGFLFKIAGAPFHNWAPDVYDESPTNVTIWLTIMPKIAIILFLLEINSSFSFGLSYDTLFMPVLSESHSLSSPINSSNNLDSSFFSSLLSSNPLSGSVLVPFVLKNIFLLSSLLSLIIGTVVGLSQKRIKRLFAYSTISHVGFLLLALGINTEQSTESLLFYLIQYTITNLNAFFILLAFGYMINSLSPASRPYINSDIRYIDQLKGQFLTNPVLSLSLAVCLFSMAGIPPLIGFFGKQSVLLSAIGSGYYFMAVIAIIVSVISASYYLKIIRDLHSDKNKEYENNLIFNMPSNIRGSLSSINKNQTKEANSYLILTNVHSFIIASLTLSIIFFIFKPSIILNSVVLCTLNLFYF